MPEVPQTAKTIFFSCMDNRLLKSDAKFIAKHGEAFHPCLAGGGSAILDPAVRPTALRQFQAAYAINAATEVYLESHTDCGAYRLAGINFESPQAEVERLYADLEEASGYVREALIEAGASPDAIEIHLRVVDPSGNLQEQA